MTAWGARSGEAARAPGRGLEGRAPIGESGQEPLRHLADLLGRRPVALRRKRLRVFDERAGGVGGLVAEPRAFGRLRLALAARKR